MSELSARFMYWLGQGQNAAAVQAVAAIVVAVFTVVLIGLTGWYASVTKSMAKTMERQVKVMEEQTLLTQAPFRQWVELRDWDSGIPLANPRKLGIRVQLVNPTKFPVTLNTGTIVFSEAPYGRTSWHVGDGRFIGAERQLGIEVFLLISAEQALQYADGTILINVNGNFSHTGILGEKMKTYQPFSGRIECGKRRPTVFYYELDMNPQAET